MEVFLNSQGLLTRASYEGAIRPDLIYEHSGSREGGLLNAELLSEAGSRGRSGAYGYRLFSWYDRQVLFEDAQ